MSEVGQGLKWVALYIIPMAGTMFVLRKLVKIPNELFRKILHFILLGAYIPFLYAFEHWWVSVAVVLALMVILYPILWLASLIPNFSSFVTERKQGEFKSSMLLALGVMALSMSVCWGGLNDKYLVLASVYAWGVGDAFAALIGKQFGKHKIKFKYADKKKSYEGSLAMFITSTIAVVIVLHLRGGLNLFTNIFISMVACLLSTFVELCTKNGLDTISCPTVALITILLLTSLFGG